MNIARALETVARHRPHQPAILFEGIGASTYRELDRGGGPRGARARAAWGVGPGDRVALCACRTFPAFAIAYRGRPEARRRRRVGRASMPLDRGAGVLSSADSGAGAPCSRWRPLWPRVAPVVGDRAPAGPRGDLRGGSGGASDDRRAGRGPARRASGAGDGSVGARFDPLHVGDDRASEGRDAEPRQHPVQRLRGQSIHAHGPRGPPAGGAAALPRRGPERADDRRVRRRLPRSMLHRRFDAARCAAAIEEHRVTVVDRRADDLHQPPRAPAMPAGGGRQRAPVQVGRPPRCRWRSRGAGARPTGRPSWRATA